MSKRTYHIDIPSRELASIDLISEQLNTIVGVLTGQLASCLVVEGLEATSDTPMDLGVNVLAICVHELESVPRVAVHVAETIGSTTVREQNHDLMDGLGVQREVILKTII